MTAALQILTCTYPPCGNTFPPATWTKRFCSNACGNLNRYNRPPTATRKGRTCEACGTTYDASRAEQRTCSRTCGDTIRTRTPRPPTANHQWPKCRVWISECHICNRPFIARRSGVTTCKNKHCQYQRYRDSIIATAHTRHRRVRGQTVERVIPSVVYERDGWICGICHQPVPHTRTRIHDPHMASLDHIIPISKGGTHSYTNTRCSHLGCNQRRGNRD